MTYKDSLMQMGLIKCSLSNDVPPNEAMGQESQKAILPVDGGKSKHRMSPEV